MTDSTRPLGPPTPFNDSEHVVALLLIWCLPVSRLLAQTVVKLQRTVHRRCVNPECHCATEENCG